MSSQCGGLESFFRIHTPYSCRQILSGSEQEAGIARPLDIFNSIEVGSKIAVQNEGSEFNLAIGLGAGCRGRLPDLQASAYTNGKVTARGREFKR
jgi:hypothetical protein